MTAARFVLYRRQPDPGRMARGVANPPGRPQLEGCVYSNGTTVAVWLTSASSVTVFASFGQFLQVHGHPEKLTEVVWLDPAPFCLERAMGRSCGCECRRCGLGYHCGQHAAGCHRNCKGSPGPSKHGTVPAGA